MGFTSPSEKDRERRKGVLDKLKNIVNHLNEEEEKLENEQKEASFHCQTFSIVSPTITCCESCPLPTLERALHLMTELNEYSISNNQSDTDKVLDKIRSDLTARLLQSKLSPYFKDEVVKISSVAPAPLQDVVVPVDIPSNLHIGEFTSEIKNVLNYAKSCKFPVGDIFSRTVLKSEKDILKLNNTALKDGKTEETSPLTSPSWEGEDLQPIINLVGASPSSVRTIRSGDVSNVEPNGIYHNHQENSFEYRLTPQKPKYISKFQLRGTQNPPWFPGYYVALPNAIKVVKSPSEVLPAAWKAVQPDDIVLIV